MSHIADAKAFLLPKFRQVFHFLTKQGFAMVGNMCYGLLCVRMLPVADYAKFAVLFGFMGSFTVLLDVGTSGTLVPLVGEQTDNFPLIANYVASIRKLGLQLYAIVAPLASIVFVFLVRKQHWSAWVVGQMLAALLVAAWFARVSGSYGAVLVLRRDRSYYYRTLIIGSLGSLALLVLFWALHFVNVYVCILLNLAQIIFNATTFYRRSRQLLGVRGKASADQEKTIIRLSLPALPNVLFYAIQGQVTLMLITFFSHNVTSVASVGALGRLSQILGSLTQINPVLVEPYFAKLKAARLKKIYVLSVLAVSAFAAAFSTCAFLFPGVFLWILGKHYQDLDLEVGLVILSSSIWFVVSFMWMVNSARRFVYWWNNVANISLTVLTQLVFIIHFDLSIMKNVLILQVLTASGNLLTVAACSVWGFWRGPQKLHNADLPEQGMEVPG